MSEANVGRLYKASDTGTFEDVRAAFWACRDGERKEYGEQALRYAAGNPAPCALDMVKFLMERGVKANSYTLHRAAGNPDPCAFGIVEFLVEKEVKADFMSLYLAVGNTGPCALDIIKLLMRHLSVSSSASALATTTDNSGEHFDLHQKNIVGETVFTTALSRGNLAVANYFLSRDDFRLSDLMPRPANVSPEIYETYREKAISRVSELIDSEGLPYTRTIAADIGKILKTAIWEPTEEDIEALKPLVGKILSTDWIADAQVSSDDFSICGDTPAP